MTGQDKGLLRLCGRPLVAWVIEAIAPQVGRVMINANRNQAAYAFYGMPVVSDEMAGFQGPLAGIMSLMSAVDTPWIVTVPCDNPFPPSDLVERLGSALTEQGAEIAVATDGKRLQPVYALIPAALARDLRAFLASGERKLGRWYRQYRMALADFSHQVGCFTNINCADDLAFLQQSLSMRDDPQGSGASAKRAPTQAD